MNKNSLTKIALIVMGIFSFSGFGSCQASAQKPAEKPANTDKAVYRKISAAEAKKMIDGGKDAGTDVIILDVRTPAEYQAQHIKGAILIPNETINQTPPKELPNLNATILIYCRSGNRSAQSARKLIAMGYTNVYDFGGIGSWSYGTVSGSGN